MVKHIHDQMEDNGTFDKVQVALRIKPLMRSEKACEECFTYQNHQQVLIKDVPFTYNYVFPPSITQQEFYDTAVKGLISKLFQGYNVTVLAYGQTGSGKTYTMGTSYNGSDGDSNRLGVIPKAVADIFGYIEAHEDEFTSRVTVSFMELYREQCYDLLSDKERSHTIIDIREDINKGVVLPGLTELSVTSTKETMMVLERGSLGRATGSTAMNQSSSRSHAVFTIVIAMESRTDKNIATTSKFHLVDLAGSERVKKTKASGERLKEGVKINQGLLALGNVISALGDGTKGTFINYRDSKLTRLLQDSLGGNSLTLMVACVSPADYNMDETVSTLRYADRARRIRNKPVINRDARAAEIVRLNNMVNDLRLQLLGKLPAVGESKNEQLEEELQRERSKYQQLLKKHKQVTEFLSSMLIDNTNLCEKALLAEAAKENVDIKLIELTEKCNQTVDNLNVTDSPDKEDANKTTLIVEYLKDLKSKLEDLQTVNLRTNEELIDHDINVSLASDCDPDNLDEVPMNEEQAVVEEEKRAIGHVALTQELRELNHKMAVKASVVQAILASNKSMLDSHSGLRENEERIARLERERDRLTQQLRMTKTKDRTHEERRSKVSALESEITELKKKCQQQASIIKTKEKNEAQVAAANAELHAMKSTKVKIIRQMREESEKFRKWKADSERALLRLRTEDRKRASAMAKVEALHTKQHNVLKRKMEEAVAVNRRLKEALDRQKVSHLQCNARGVVKADAVQAYIEQQLEMHLSIVEAEISLEELIEDRAMISQQMEKLRNSTDSEDNRRKLAELENDLAMRKAQISDLQQKILTADQENKSHTQWDNIQSMLEAKVALKVIFDMLVEAKRQLQEQSEKGFQSRYQEIKDAYDQLKADYESNKIDYERQLQAVKTQSKQELTEVVALQRGLVGAGRRETRQHLQNRMQRLDQCEKENKKLTEELKELRSATKKMETERKKQQQEPDEVIDLSDEDDGMLELSDEDDDDDGVVEDDNDPEWRATPMHKRKEFQKPSRLEMNFRKSDEKYTSSDTFGKRAVKRGSDGSRHCACQRGACASRACGCVKHARSCGASCRCQPALCRNKLAQGDTDDKDNNPSSAEPSAGNEMRPSYFDNAPHRERNVKRKKHYFFGPESNGD